MTIKIGYLDDKRLKTPDYANTKSYISDFNELKRVMRINIMMFYYPMMLILFGEK